MEVRGSDEPFFYPLETTNNHSTINGRLFFSTSNATGDTFELHFRLPAESG
jgi:hypothetical protein